MYGKYMGVFIVALNCIFVQLSPIHMMQNSINLV